MLGMAWYGSWRIGIEPTSPEMYAEELGTTMPTLYGKAAAVDTSSLHGPDGCVQEIGAVRVIPISAGLTDTDGVPVQ